MALEIDYTHVDYSSMNRSRLANANDHGVDAKIVIMGNSGVGKTSLLQRYTQNKFDPKNTTSTTGAFFVTKKVYVDGMKVRLQLWDTAGQERFRSMAPMYYRGANAALLLYDITNASSFDDVKGWLEELKKNCAPDLLIYIVGSKADLHRHRQVSHDRARLFLHKWFPPPRPPSPAPSPPPSTQMTFAGGFSYIRPRFISLTPAASASGTPHLEGKAKDDSYVARASALARSHSSGPAVAFRSHSSRSTPTPTSVPSLSPLRLGGLGRANSTASNTNSNSNSSRSTFDRRPPLAQPSSSKLGSHSHSYFGFTGSAWNNLNNEIDVSSNSNSNSNSNSVPEEDENELEGDEDEGDAMDDTEWGLTKDMALFEVSAKDSSGVEHLFSVLISTIVTRTRREQEKRERERQQHILENGISTDYAYGDGDYDGRKRDSVFLPSTATQPAWARLADEEEAAMEKAERARGGCCSI